jgi:hypothetical protein
LLYWSAKDFESKPEDFKTYDNGCRIYNALDGQTPSDPFGERILERGSHNQDEWTEHRCGLFQMPVIQYTSRSSSLIIPGG